MVRKQVAVGNRKRPRQQSFTPWKQALQWNSRRNLQDQCEVIKKVQTPYNDNDAVPVYAGIMFEMFSKSEIEILSFEIDIRVKEKANLSVEVYTKQGGFSDAVNDESLWEKVADTKLVRAPEGEGGIVPVADFATVSMPMRTKRSFYITMRKKFIESTVNALQKTGEKSYEGPDFDILTGSGLTTYKFPEKVDRIVNPMFAGVVHYQSVASCDSLKLSTELTFQFLVGQNSNPGFPAELNAALDGFVDSMLDTSASLKEYVSDAGLERVDPTRTGNVPFQSKSVTVPYSRTVRYMPGYMASLSAQLLRDQGHVDTSRRCRIGSSGVRIFEVDGSCGGGRTSDCP